SSATGGGRSSCLGGRASRWRAAPRRCGWPAWTASRSPTGSCASSTCRCGAGAARRGPGTEPGCPGRAVGSEVMLAEMRIQGLGVIDDATLELDPGLTVLTGETGAGKTMVVTGLSLLGGGRAEASRVAGGARRAVVEGRFTADAAAMAVADEVGADADEDGTLIAVRTVSADGRSRAHLGGRSVPVGVLSRLAEATLAVHGQNDQLRLLRPAEQRALLDRFAGEAVTG